MGFTIEKLRFNHWKVEQAGWWRLPRLTINNVDLDINICGKHGEQALFCFAINEDAKLHWRASKINHAWPAPLKSCNKFHLMSKESIIMLILEILPEHEGMVQQQRREHKDSQKKHSAAAGRTRFGSNANKVLGCSQPIVEWAKDRTVYPLVI